MKYLRSAIEHIDKWPRAFSLLFGLNCVLLLAALDAATHYELSFSIFYTLPVSFIAWHVGRRAGLATSLVTIVLWAAASYLAGAPHSAGVFVWNACSRLGVLVFITFVLSLLRKTLDHEKKLARHDHLTGLLNSHAFYEAANNELHRSRRYDHPLTLAYIDLDNFKKVNDTWGHSTGDRLLQTIAQTIRSQLRDIDMIARLGGDEFAILLPETGFDQARSVLERVRRTTLAELQKNGWPVSLSIGAQTCNASELETVDKIIKQADAQMYEIKNSGKNDISHRRCG